MNFTRGRRILQLLPVLLLAGLAAFTRSAAAQLTFDVASIRPSAAEVKFEHNGKTEYSFGTLKMRDVTVATCIALAYGKQHPLISGPPLLRDKHYDITAKTQPDTGEERMRLMLRTLLSERFKLGFHTETKELRAYVLTVAPTGIKMKPSAPGGTLYRENNDHGMVARSISMQELTDYMADALGAPLADGTGLTGRYDLSIDFTSYVDQEHNDVRPDPVAVLKAALKGELGLELVQRRAQVEVFVVDHVEPPSGN